MHTMRAKFERRRFIKASLLGAATAMVPIGAEAALRAVEQLNLILQTAPTRTLSFYNVHTGESLKALYFERGEYVPGALAEVNHFFRDFRANQEMPIDPRLLDLLHRINHALDTS